MGDLETALVTYRRDLHQMPELGFEEHKTHDYLMAALAKMGIVGRTVATTGIVADIEGRGPGRTVLLRADMDGLPLTEETGLEFASRHDGVMHACGHDAHMAILLASAERLSTARDFDGRVRLLFQPAEEKPPGGAPALIEAGVLDGVDEVYGLHIWADDPVGTVGLTPGAVMANADQFTIRVEGRGGHGSQPENTQDAVLIASQIVVNLQTVVSRRVSAMEPAVVTCGTIESGHIFNIIAETATITGTVRTFSESAQSIIAREMAHIAETTAALYGARATLQYMKGYPAVVNQANAVEKWTRALEGVLEVRQMVPSMGGEDFAYYLHHRPGAFLFLGGRPQTGEAFPHHSPHFAIDEAALPMGVEAMTRIARASLGG